MDKPSAKIDKMLLVGCAREETENKNKFARVAEIREKMYIQGGEQSIRTDKDMPFFIKLKLIKRQIEIKGELVIAIDGESMFPFIKNGDFVRIKRLSTISIGQIVLFYTNDIFGNAKFVLHRIVKTDCRKIWTKGDNSDKIDEYIYVENILGEFVEVV